MNRQEEAIEIKIKQAARINTLSEMMTEEMGKYLDDQYSYDEWLKTKPGNYMLMPDVHTENLKRIMLMVRKETLKFEKMMWR